MKKLKPGDILIFAVIICISVAIFASFRIRTGAGHAVAQIIRDGEVIRTIDLDQVDEPIIIELKGKYNNIIIAEERTIRFERSDCPDRICEKMGRISRPGQTAVCVPAGVIINIIGSAEDDTDIVIR
ncbi:MAG: NusG domain II-containing protein [Clostridia bacterium]|jgi:hypothetical protein|nr:NusG domain II-containing protein [Clostridiaceae bacterium]